METIKDENENILDIFENKIDYYITEFIESHEIDLTTAPASQFNALLMYIRKNVFPDKSILKDKKLTINTGNYIPSNNKR